VVTDLGVLRPDPQDRELVLVAVHPGVEVEQVREATGWPLRVSDAVTTTEAPTDEELSTLREMRAGR
jgi:acyl CoA:acetate/3-ketoacid CoA transferase beta subunit